MPSFFKKIIQHFREVKITSPALKVENNQTQVDVKHKIDNKLIQIGQLQKKTLTRSFSVSSRIDLLKKMKSIIAEHQQAIIKALHDDMNKTDDESYQTEYLQVLKQIDFSLKNIVKWTKLFKEKCATLFGKSEIINHVAKGKIAIIGTNNYPFLSCFIPLISAISAGNVVLVVGSSQTLNTTSVVKHIIHKIDNPDTISFLNQNEISSLSEIYDEYLPQLIFFSGRYNMGKIIATECCKRNIDFIIQKDGYCPFYIDYASEKNLNSWAEKIVKMKVINAGQSCIGGDYYLVHKSVFDKFTSLLIENFQKQCPNYEMIAKICDKNTFLYLKKVIEQYEEHIVYGGHINYEKMLIEPTIIQINDPRNSIKEPKVFGPIILISKIDDINIAAKIINEINWWSLVVYVFSKNTKNIKLFRKNINANLIIVNGFSELNLKRYLPFGGTNWRINLLDKDSYFFLVMSNIKSTLTAK